MKKLLLMVLSLIMSISMLSGCILVPPKDDVAEDEITISRWASALEESQFRAWSNKFTQANPDIKVKWNFLPYEAHFSTLTTTLLSETASDVVCLNNWGWYGYRNSDSLFVDFNEVDELQDAINGLIPEAKSRFISSTGKRLALANGSVTRRPVVNTDDFDTAGVAVPYNRTTSFTLSELSALLNPIVQHSGVRAADNSTKYGINFNETELMFILAASAGAPIYNKATNKVEVNTPAGIAAMTELRRFYRNSGRAQVPLAESASLGNDAAMTTTTCVASYSGTYNYENLRESGYNFAAIPTVKAAGGVDTLLLEFNNFAVPQFSKKKGMVYRFIAWALSEAGQTAFASFSDLPTNAAAYEKVTTTGEARYYNAFNVGINNVYVMDALPSIFSSAISTNLSELIEGAGDDTAKATEFCAAMAALNSSL